MPNYGRYYKSKKEEKEAHQIALWLFVSPFVIGISFGIIQRVFTGSYPGAKSSGQRILPLELRENVKANSVRNFRGEELLPKDSSITCAQAQNQWESALEKRDAITPQKAMTSFGRANWEQLRDKANELEQVKNNICN